MLKVLPPDFGKLKNLKILFCSNNLFQTLPEVLGDCPLLDIVGFKANQITHVPEKALNDNLRWLILTDNQIQELPAQIGQCIKMQKLMLAGNQLKSLPQELRQCLNLSLLRISANQLTELPLWLLSMPKLSWLAFSGNLIGGTSPIDALRFIDWKQLKIEQVLGEGASGVISKAIWNDQAELKEVAIKLFKGAVTSDGLPEDEMNTCIAAGAHPGLVQIIGQINGHPENKQGLVMGLIADRFYNLGLPPSFESCTRDVYKEGSNLISAQILKIALTIASVAAQLHERGIMHGDLYAHNILIDKEGHTLFGDFGAACFYDKTDGAVAAGLERIEVQAYGYLLDDLLSLSKEADHYMLMEIGLLRDSCFVPDVISRPSFNDLQKALLKL
jgi:hypothetical protein